MNIDGCQPVRRYTDTYMDTSSTVCVTVQSTDPISTTHIGLQREERERERTATAGVKLLLMPLLIPPTLSQGHDSANKNANASSIIHTIHYGQHQAEGILCLVRVGQIDNKG